MTTTKQAQRPYTLDLHRMHDGVWCALILPRYSAQAIARAFATTRFAAARAAIAKAEA
jgi:hypothetical protein